MRLKFTRFHHPQPVCWGGTAIHLNVINTVLCVSLEKRTYCMTLETINITEIDLNRIAVVGKYSLEASRQ